MLFHECWQSPPRDVHALAGVMGNLVGVAPASAIFMAVYEPVKQAVMARVPENRQFLAPLGGGAAAGLVASVVRVPTEVVKQRMQNGGWEWCNGGRTREAGSRGWGHVKLFIWKQRQQRGAG